MKTVQMTLDEKLLKEVDNIAKKLHTSRSAFTREALEYAVKRQKEIVMEAKHKKGYELKPVTKDEDLTWEDEQEWGER